MGVNTGRICRCCGDRMRKRAEENPHICLECSRLGIEELEQWGRSEVVVLEPCPVSNSARREWLEKEWQGS